MVTSQVDSTPPTLRKGGCHKEQPGAFRQRIFSNNFLEDWHPNLDISQNFNLSHFLRTANFAPDKHKVRCLLPKLTQDFRTAVDHKSKGELP